jgi:hypothetical protein
MIFITFRIISSAKFYSVFQLSKVKNSNILVWKHMICNNFSLFT